MLDWKESRKSFLFTFPFSPPYGEIDKTPNSHFCFQTMIVSDDLYSMCRFSDWNQQWHIWCKLDSFHRCSLYFNFWSKSCFKIGCSYCSCEMEARFHGFASIRSLCFNLCFLHKGVYEGLDSSTSFLKYCLKGLLGKQKFFLSREMMIVMLNSKSSAWFLSLEVSEKL